MKRYSKVLFLTLAVFLSVLMIFNLITANQDDILHVNISCFKFIIFIIINIATSVYIMKLIGRLNVNRKKLVKSSIYVSECINQILKKGFAIVK